MTPVAAADPWALDRLFEYLRIPSVSAQKRGVAEAVAFLTRLFSEAGFATETVATAGNPVLLAERRCPGAARSIVFYNHYDVQPPEPLDLWTSPPFEPVVRDGRIWARGVSDNKANLIARVAAIRTLLAKRPELPLAIRFVVEGEEEMGSPHLPEFAHAQLARITSDLCVWENGARNPAGSLELILGCKGVLHLELRLRSLARDQHSSRGAILPSAPWRLLWALASLKGPDEKIRIRGFYDNVRRTTLEDLECLKRIPFDEAHQRELSGGKGFLLGLRGQDLLHRLYFEPAINVNGLTSGYQGEGNKTVLPAVASAKLDVRLVPDQTPDGVLKLLGEHLEQRGFGDVDIAYAQGYPPARTPVNHPMVELVAAAAEAATGRPAVRLPMMPASGPMHLFARAMPLVGVGTGHPDSRAHAPDENVYVEDFATGARVVAEVLTRLAEGGRA